jgi:hypothetical protein
MLRVQKFTASRSKVQRFNASRSRVQKFKEFEEFNVQCSNGQEPFKRRRQLNAKAIERAALNAAGN